MNPLDYELPTDGELIAITFLDRLATRLGNPPDFETQQGLKLLDATIGVWMKECRQEAKDWAHDTAIDKTIEKDLATLAREGHHNPVGYPPTLYALIKAMFPGIKLQKREVFRKLVKIYPNLFMTSNYT